MIAALPITLCLLGYLSWFCWFFSKSTVSKNSFTMSNTKLGFRSGPTFCRSWSGSKLFAKFNSWQQKWQRSYSKEIVHFTYLRLNAFCDSLTPSYQSPQNFLLVTSAFIWKKMMDIDVFSPTKCDLLLYHLSIFFIETLVRCTHGWTQTGGGRQGGHPRGMWISIPLPLENLKCYTCTPSPPHTRKSFLPTPPLKNVLP